MFDVENTLASYGLTTEKYEELLKDCSDKVHKISDLEWQDIVSKYNLDIHYDTCRKASQPELLGSVFVSEYYKWKESMSKNSDDDSYMDELAVMKREIQREKIKFRDERNAWQKQNYNSARIEETLDILEEKIENQGKINFEIHDTPSINGDNDLLVMLTDLHLGQTFDSTWGTYNTDIAEERLNQYLDEILSIQKSHNSEKCYVSIQGDLISGNIHSTIQISNKEDVIEQMKIAIELISSFCEKLTQYFKRVYVYNVSGNHSRLIENKNNAVHSERLDDFIGWDVGKTLKHIENFNMVQHRNLDLGIAEINIRGKSYIAVHGDYDAFNKQGALNLCSMLGFFPEAILYGHLHTPSSDEVNGIKLIRSGSLAGAGDDYTIEKRLCGRPSQTVLVCNNKGIKCIYNVSLD